VQEVASQAKEKVQEQTQNMRAQAQEKARTQLETRSTQVGEQAGSIAEALRSTGRQLDGEANSAGAKAAHAAADQVERLGGYLRDGSADRFLDDVESFARRKPWAAAGIGAAAGFLASRFLKASSENRYDTSQRSRADSNWPVTRGLYDEPLYQEAGAYPLSEPVAGGDPLFPAGSRPGEEGL